MEEFNKINLKIKDYMDNDANEIYDETIRIANYAINIAQSEMMNKEDVKLVYLIASLNNLGKLTENNTITLLFDEEKIREFSDDIKNDDIIRDVIYAVSEGIVPDFYDEVSKKLIHIINDSISLNEIYKLSNENIYISNNQKINKNILNDFSNYQKCKKIDVHSKIDEIVFTISNIFNFKYKYSLYEIEKQDLLNKINDNLNLQNQVIVNLFEQLKKIVMKYIKLRIGEAYHGW